MVAFSRFDPAEPFGNFRVRARFVSVDAGGIGSPCFDDAACLGGHCVDGVCCESACGGGDESDCLACSVLAGGAEDGLCATARAGTMCRDAAGPCDLPERCDGSDPECPVHSGRPEGAVCSVDPCSTPGTCAQGSCTGAEPAMCSAVDACLLGGSCEEGTCSLSPAPDGTPCATGTCHGGWCTDAGAESGHGADETGDSGGDCACRTVIMRREPGRSVLFWLVAVAIGSWAVKRRRAVQ